MRARAFVLALLLAVQLAAAGCSDDSNEMQSSVTPVATNNSTASTAVVPSSGLTPAPTNRASSAGAAGTFPVHPRGTLTNIAAVDGLLRAVYGGQMASLADRVVMTPLACGSAPMGPPPCPAGARDGTVIPTFLLSSCQPNYTDAFDTIRQQLAAFNSAGLQLAGVYEPARYQLPVAYAVAMVGAMNQAMTTFFVDAEGSLAGVASCTPFFPASDAKVLFDAPTR